MVYNTINMMHSKYKAKVCKNVRNSHGDDSGLRPDIYEETT